MQGMAHHHHHCDLHPDRRQHQDHHYHHIEDRGGVPGSEEKVASNKENPAYICICGIFFVPLHPIFHLRVRKIMRQIREAIITDLPAIMPVIDAARELMHRSGNVNQWINGYPSEEAIASDIDRDGGFVVIDDERIVAYFAFLPSPEPTYAKIYEGAWMNDEPYYVIHRLASLPDVHGIWNSILEWAFERTTTLRVDTHRDNHIMQHNILKHGFTYCGIIYLLSGDERLAYQKTIRLQE